MRYRWGKITAGRPRLWLMTTIVKLGMVLLGAALRFGGRHVTSSPAYTPPRRLMEAFAVSPAHAIGVWAVLFMLIGGLGVIHGSIARPARRGSFVIAIGAIWTLWAGMLVSYGLGHDGLGLPGAVLYLTIAGLCFPLGLGWIAYAQDLDR